jgi:lipid II:glycine glycyltransferase (peptidoglycan interpeptide bridge formation enzyme)
MKVKSVTIQEWQEFVESLPNYNFFQLPIWAQVHKKAFPACEIATKLFIFDDGVQVLLPLVKTAHKFGFEILESLPWGWYGGFLWNKKPSKAQLRQILKHLLTRKVLHLEINPGPWDSENRELLENSGLKKRPAFTHVLELSAGHQWLWENRIDRNCRNQVRKAIKSGVTIIPIDDVAQIKAYYDIYLDSAHRWGLPKSKEIPLQYFESLFQLGGDRVKCYLARYDGKYISGGFTAYDSSGCVYLNESMLKEYGRYCPNNLLRNKLLEDACARGCRFFNFGGSEGLSPGVQDFKESWGAEKLDYEYFVYESPLLRLYKKVRTLAPFWKKPG